MQIASIVHKIKAALAKNKAEMAKADRRALAIMAVLGIFTLGLAPELALAGGNPWDTGASAILAIFTGGLTRTLAIIAVIACGIAAIAGKLSWDWAIKIIVGIVLIFGSTAIVDYVIASSH